jgi:hypothetical protein
MKFSVMVQKCKSPKVLGSVVLAALFLSGCSDDSSKQVAVQEELAVTEAFNFSHDYDGAAVVGEKETIKLNMTEQHQTGVISVTVHGDDSLFFNSLRTQSFDLADANSIVMDLVFTPNTAGEKNLNIIVDIDEGTGERKQEVFDIALSVAPM